MTSVLVRPPFVLAIVALLCCARMVAQFPAKCDTRKTCVGQAIEFTVSSGRNAQYIELDGEVSKPRQTELTVEMWVMVTRQAGFRVPLGGLWGPNKDYNDVWVLYISENDELSFEVSPEATQLKDVDNTVARAAFSPYYGTWTHVAAVFNGNTASVQLFINGVPAGGPATNATYPTTYLKPLENPGLQTQFARCNAMADNEALYRTMLGQMDEMRIWNRVVSPQDIKCRMNSSLAGNEPGLQAYYRCNEPVNNLNDICDATGHGHAGALRAQATNKASKRSVPRTVIVSPQQVTEQILCDSVRSWTFTIEDTSECGSTVNLRIRGPEASAFTVTPTQLPLVKGVPVTATVTYKGTHVGDFLDTLQISGTNRCGSTAYIKLNLTRITELNVSRNSIVFDTLLVGCKAQQFIDSSITICNTSDLLGAPRSITITSMNTREPQGFRVMNVTFPLQLAPGACTTVVVRSFVRDTTNDYSDTIRLVSTDRCQSRPIEIVLQGRTQEVISVRSTSGEKRIDNLKFGSVCPGQLSSPAYYVWSNLTLTPLTIDTIIVPPDFTHYKVRLPFTVLPKTGYDPIAVRFRPRAPGPVTDSIIIRTKVGGCVIERVIKVSGRGLDNRVEWSVDSVDFGDVVVGRQRTLNVTARNLSPDDPLTISLYVERGASFVLLAGTGRTIPPNSTVQIPVTFRPIDSVRYTDRLCLFETRCYTVDCVDLRGRGVLERFRFSPLVMKTENVVACGSEKDTVCIVNISGAPQQIRNVQFDNPSGRYSLVDPPVLQSAYSIAGGDSVCFVVEYTPADLTTDRADRAFVRFTDEADSNWTLQLIGTSATPKIFITELTAYGTVEVGDAKVLTLVVENTSPMPITIDSLSVGAGFSVAGTSRPVPLVLQPRDSITVDIEFRPTASTAYNSQLVAYSSAPCQITGEGQVNGRGIIMELESALSLVNFGYVRPCDCSNRSIELLNASAVFDMVVDSMWIDSAGVTGGRPQFFSWTSKFSPTGVVPYSIPPGQRDTVVIRFCPNVPADSASLEVQAMLHINTHGSAWSRSIEAFLIGKRALTFAPYPLAIQFPSGVIDILSPIARTVRLSIPSFVLNPAQDTVVIDSIGFLPDERVFVVTQPTVFPLVLEPGSNATIEVRQRPRAPRVYLAKMVIYYSKPCKGADTTVLVRGEGFAQPRGIAFQFDPNRVVPDTFVMASCDTLVIPLHSSISIDASVVDIFMRVDYDSSQLRLLDVTSPLLSNQCTSRTGGIQYTSSVMTDVSPYGGIRVTLKNVCGVDSLNPFAYLRFVTVANNRANSPVSVDSINFDTEDVILYRLIGVGDRGTIIAQLSDIAIRNPVAFDSVRILDCSEHTIVVVNVGDISNTIDSLVDLPLYTSVVSSIPPIGSSIAPGDSAVVTLRFCPQAERQVDTTVRAVSTTPCNTQTVSAVTGYGYAPELDIQTAPAVVHFVIDTISGVIGDTLEIPLQLDVDIATVYNGVTHWLNGTDAEFRIEYNPRSLQYLDAVQLAKPGNSTVNYLQPGIVVLTLTDADTLAAGPLARFRFVVTVPEFTATNITATASGFVSDSLQFLDVVPRPGQAPFVTVGKCDITVVRFSTAGQPLLRIDPNPVTADQPATIQFRMHETVPVVITINDASGRIVHSVLDGNTLLPGGSYAVRLDVADLPSGMYVARISAGIFTDTVPFVVIR